MKRKIIVIFMFFMAVISIVAIVGVIKFANLVNGDIESATPYPGNEIVIKKLNQQLFNYFLVLLVCIFNVVVSAIFILLFHKGDYAIRYTYEQYKEMRQKKKAEKQKTKKEKLQKQLNEIEKDTK